MVQASFWRTCFEGCLAFVCVGYAERPYCEATDAARSLHAMPTCTMVVAASDSLHQMCRTLVSSGVVEEQELAFWAQVFLGFLCPHSAQWER